MADVAATTSSRPPGLDVWVTDIDKVLTSLPSGVPDVAPRLRFLTSFHLQCTPEGVLPHYGGQHKASSISICSSRSRTPPSACRNGTSGDAAGTSGGTQRVSSVGYSRRAAARAAVPRPW